MGKTAAYKHSYNTGDLITVMPGMKKIWEETGLKAVVYQRLNVPADYSHADYHPIKNDRGENVCMNQHMFDMLKPLVESQPYVESFTEWQGEKVDFDFDMTRRDTMMPLPGGSIHHWPSLIFPQLSADTSNSWLAAEHFPNEKIIINRTERYHNPYIDYFFLKDHLDELIFAGTYKERTAFCKDFNLQIPHLQVNNFLHLASVIKSCRFFIGNQSLCFHLADAMKVPRILEVCSAFPNTFPTGEKGFAFIAQGALEYFFNKLLNDTDEKTTA